MPFYSHKAADNASSAALFSTLSFSLHRQDIPHSPGGFFLGAGGDVGVGVQGEAGGEAAQHAGRCSAEGFMEKALFPSLQTSFGIFHASWSVCKSA